MGIFDIISLSGGLALFLYGMRIMGDGLKKESTGSFKTALEKVTNNPIMGFLVGVGLTAIIQSSTATIVIASGLVSAGIMTLSQSIGIIIGANVGTTITGQIIRLLDVDSSGAAWLSIFKPSTLAPIAAIIGIVFVMFVNTRKSNTIGTIAMGFGILFTGLLNMTQAVIPLSEDPKFLGLFISFGDTPILGFLVGFAVAFILQSSSATIGILQALSITGVLTFASVYPIICGIYLGDCVTTAMVCSIGTSADAKRTGIVNILFNLSEIVIIAVAVNAIHACGGLEELWDSVLNSGGIANAHTAFKLACAIILLPLAKTYEKLSTKIVKDSDGKNVIPEITALDDRLFSSPALALSSAYKGLLSIRNKISQNLTLAVSLITDFDDKIYEQIVKDEDYIDKVSDAIGNYLVRLSPHLKIGSQDIKQHYYLQCSTDLERAADHVYEIAKTAEMIHDRDIDFSNDADEQLSVIAELVNSIVEYTGSAMVTQNVDAAKEIQPLCEIVTSLIEKAKEGHMNRLIAGECNSVSGSAYLDLLMHFGRVADMCSNVGVHTLARHSDGIENFEHEYISSLRHGDDEMFNIRLAELEDKYL